MCNCEGCGCGCGRSFGVTGLAHVGVFVSDMERSLKFYTDVLGFECYFRTELPGGEGPTKLSFLQQGTCEIELVQPAAGEKRRDGAVDHIAMRVSGIDAFAEQLKVKGVSFDTEKPMEIRELFENGVKCIFFRGPDGERLELSEEI